jgi:asparagine synthetase B (glutamine-hydrolysing)
VRVFTTPCQVGNDRNAPNNAREYSGPTTEVLVRGNLYVGSDADFGPTTRLEALGQYEAPGTLERLYRRHGLDALARLDGNFNALIHLRDERKLILVVDKFGCNDIFYRAESDRLVFGSHPAMVAPVCALFDVPAVAFLLAQESFVPAPFTLMPAVRSVGRARCLIVEYGGEQLKTRLELYWQLKPSWDIRTRDEAISLFGDLLSRSIDLGIGSRTALMLSGGIDSSLLLSLTTPKVQGEMVTIT